MQQQQSQRAAEAAKKKKKRVSQFQPLHCMICVFVSSALLLTAIVILASIVRAVSEDVDGRRDDDDTFSPANHHHHHHSKRRLPASVPAELNTLEVLGDAVDQGQLDQSGWLPASRKRAIHLDPYDNRVAAAAAASSKAAAVHRLDLRGHRRISHDTYYLGAHPNPKDPNTQLESYAFLHYATNEEATAAAAHLPAHMQSLEHNAKHRHFNRTAADTLRHHQNKRQVVACGAPIAIGARWKTSKGYYVHPRNSGGMPYDRVIEQTEAAVDAWRCVLQEIHAEPVGSLLGVVIEEGDEDAMELHRPSGENRFAFAELVLPDGHEDQTLAVTISHGRFAGAVEERFISEFTTIFNDAYLFDDCADVNANCKRTGAIDYQSIGTHEHGHGLGLDDLYSSECRDATLYWSAQAGEINKRSLEQDDKLAILALYLDN